MNCRQILVLTALGHGHVYPVLPLCRELARRGHRITYAVNSEYVDAVRSAECEALLYSSSAPGIEVTRWWNSVARLPFDHPNWYAPPKAFWSDLHRDTASLYAGVRRTFSSEYPDFVLYDQYFYPGYVTARRLGLPRVRLSAHFATCYNLLAWRNGKCESPAPLLEWARQINRFRWEEGVETNGETWPIEDLNIHFVPEAFQYSRSFFGSQFYFAGRSINRHYPRTWIDREPSKKLVLISGLSGLSGLGEATDHFTRIVEALSGPKFRCVVLGKDEAASSRSLPSNMEICSTESPLEILPSATLHVCHGGMGSTLEAIYFGVPVLALPSHPTADEVAYRLAELGLGTRMLRSQATIENIQTTVSVMLDDTDLRARVQSMRSNFEHIDGTRGAADRIEHFMAAR